MTASLLGTSISMRFSFGKWFRRWVRLTYMS